MKTIIRKTVLVALMLGTFSSYATGTTLLENKATEAKVELVNVKKGQRLYIKNSEGDILYQEKIQRNGTFVKNFDFSSLKDGNYTLEINKDFEIEVSPFSVQSGKAIFNKKEEKTIFKPVVRTNDNKVMVSKFDFEAAPLQVTIYYEGDVIFKETVTGGNVLQRVYKLRKEIKGDYKVVMKANDRSYTNEFSL
jgi:hypothetical protein